MWLDYILVRVKFFLFYLFVKYSNLKYFENKKFFDFKRLIFFFCMLTSIIYIVKY